MIIGFTHITRNVHNGVVQTLAGSSRRPAVEPIPSAPEKWPLMARRASLHQIFMGGSQIGPVVECVEYETGVVEDAGRLDRGLGKAIVSARDPHKESTFFRDGIGFQGSGQPVLEFRAHVPQWGVTVEVCHDPDAPIDPPLDIAGYAALAFYSSDVEADRDHLLKHGGRTPTEPFTVKLDRKMKIVMLRSPEGTIIELIQVVK